VHPPAAGAPPQLVVARATRLEVYRLAFGGGGGGGGGGVNNTTTSTNYESSRLELVGAWPLYGVVEDMAVLPAAGRRPGDGCTGAAASTRDALMLSFRDAKVSVVAWDPAAHDLRTVSLHAFDRPPALGGKATEGTAGAAAAAASAAADAQNNSAATHPGGGRKSFPDLRKGRRDFAYPPRVVADPQGRCAACVFFGHQVAIFPPAAAAVQQGTPGRAASAAADALLDAALFGGGVGGSGSAGGAPPSSSTPSLSDLDSPSSALGPAYVIDLSTGEEATAAATGRLAAAAAAANAATPIVAGDVRDACFLHGYSEPVLLLLHEDPPVTWAARLSRRRDTCAVTALSLNLKRRRHPAIWRARGLPSDAYALSAAPGGGALVLCQNLVLYRAQGASASLALNSNAFASAEQPPKLPLPVHYAAAANPMLAGGAGAAAAAVAAGDPAASAAASRWARTWATAIQPGSASACARGADRAEGLEAEADAARVAWLSPHAALLALRSGQLLQLGLHLRGGGGAGGGGGGGAGAGGGGGGPARLSAVAVGGASVPSCACTLTRDLLFLGSWTGDSLLVRYGLGGAEWLAAPAAAAAVGGGGAGGSAAAAAAPGQTRALPEGNGTATAPDAKRRRQSMHLASMEMGGGLEGATAAAEAAEAAAAAAAAAAQGADDEGAVVKAEDEEQAGAAAAGATATAAVDDDDIYRGAVGRSSSAHLPEAAAAAAAAVAAEQQQQQQAAAQQQQQGSDRYRFKVMDSLTCIGPIRDMVVAELALGLTGTLPGAAAGAGAAGPDAGAASAATRPPQSLVAAVGEDKSGALAVLRRGVLADVVTRVPLPLARGAWAVRWRGGGGEGGGGSNHHHAFLLLTLAAAGGAGASAASASATPVRGRTMVLDARGEQLRELRGADSAFVGDAPTLAAGELLGGTAIVQVTPSGCRLLEGPAERSQDVDAASFCGGGGDEEAITVVAAAIESPYVLLRLSNGACVLLRAGEGGGGGGAARTLAPLPGSPARLLDAPAADVNARVCAAALYRDGSGWMASAAGLSAASSGRVFLFVARLDGRLEGYALPPEEGDAAAANAATAPAHFPRSPVFFEDELVIGHDVVGGPERDPEAREAYEELDLDVDVPCVSDLRVDCFPAASGSAAGVPAAERPLLLASLSDGSLLAYQAYRLPRGENGGGVEEAQEEEAAAEEQEDQQPPAPPPQRSRRFAFKRLALLDAALGHEDPALADPAEGAAADGPSFIDPSDPGRLLPRLVRFDGLVAPGPAAGAAAATAQGGVAYSGVFVCGARPLWLVASRGGLVAHPMYRDAPVSGMTAFHNVNCPHGFVLCKAPGGGGSGGGGGDAAAAAAATADLRICQLPAQARLDTPWLCHKLPLRATPARLTWCPDARVLAVLACRLGPHRPHLPEEAGGDPFSSLMYAASDATARSAGREDVWELRLIRPPSSGAAAAAAAAAAAIAGGAAESSAALAAAAAAHAPWSAKPAWSYALLPGEEATALANVRLRDTAKGATIAACPEEAFVAVGAACLFGEDYPAVGRLLLFQVGRGGGEEGAADEPAAGGRPSSAVTTTTSLRGRLALWREYTGAVAAIESVRSSYLLLGVGSRVEVHYLRANQLVKAAFVDVPSLPTSLSVVKDFVLVGDACAGPMFLRYRDAQRSLELLSNDYDAVDGACAEFLPNASKLGLVVGDARGNLVVYSYDASDPESWAGKRLLRRGAIHTGAMPTRLARLRMAPPDGANRQALLVGNRDGGVGLLASLWGDGGGGGGVGNDALLARLRSLQQELALRLPHAAGLNPRAFRGRTRADPACLGGGRQWSRPLAPQDNGIVQGDLLLRYASLDLRAQACVADAIGLVGGREQVLADLRALAAATAFL
jgi:cleavage and polyadenylation specificity factor subunit 1